MTNHEIAERILIMTDESQPRWKREQIETEMRFWAKKTLRRAA